MSTPRKSPVLPNMVSAAVAVMLVLYLVDTTVFIVRGRYWRGPEQTDRVLRQWRSAHSLYHIVYERFPSESHSVVEVAAMLSRERGGEREALPTVDGFGRPLIPGCQGRGWSQVISCGRDGISQCGEGDDMVVDLSRDVTTTPSRSAADRAGETAVEGGCEQ